MRNSEIRMLTNQINRLANALSETKISNGHLYLEDFDREDLRNDPSFQKARATLMSMLDEYYAGGCMDTRLAQKIRDLSAGLTGYARSARSG
jgi:hypothetical protein